ncbi:MAG: ABC transporter permease [Anaerolineae bacterium]|nr:ABC transporter permease [Anaerolineae bacterium]
MLRRFIRNRSAMIGAFLVGIWLLGAAAAPVLAPYEPLKQDLRNRIKAPLEVEGHYLGTDTLGRDIASRLLYGAQISIPIAIVVVAMTALLGISLGAVSGFIGGWVDEIIMRISDATLAFPSLILAMAITATLGPGLFNSAIAITLVLWPEYARFMRGQVLRVRGYEYVQAAESLGMGRLQTLLRHIVPNAIPLMWVKASLDVGQAILLAASLSFIGLGAVPPNPEWGAMAAAGREKFAEWWIGTFPGLAILSVVMGFNFLGDGLRDVLDPRNRR